MVTLVEKDINTFLIQTLDVYEKLKDKGSDDLANQVLSLGSSVANRMLLLAGIKNHKVYCKCGRQMRTGEEIEFLNHVGECMGCDHCRGDLQ